MVNLEENMMNLKNSETRFIIGYSRTLTGTKHGDCRIYQRCDRKLHCVTLSNTSAISVKNTNLFIITQSLPKIFQLKSEGDTLILNKNQPRFVLTRTYQTTSVKYFYWPLSYTRVQTMPLFWPHRSKSQKGRQPCIWKVQPSKNKITQQPSKNGLSIGRQKKIWL